MHALRSPLSPICSTFRIILRTVTDFEAPEVRAQGKAMMDSLVLSYQKLVSEAAWETRLGAHSSACSMLGVCMTQLCMP